MGGRAGGGARGMSVWSLHGAAARNELKNMTASEFFVHGAVGKEYAKYFDAENARRGNPVKVGSQGADIGDMAHFNWKEKGVSGYGRIKSTYGDKFEVEMQGGYSWYVAKSSITHYTKDKSVSYTQLKMKKKITRKSKRVMSFGRS